MLDSIKIEQIKKRLYSTTPGKWVTHDIPYGGEITEEPSVYTKDDVFVCATVYEGLSFSKEHRVEADTIFIASAKSDIEYLLSIIENNT